MHTSLADHSSCEDCREGSSREGSEGCDTGPREGACYEAELESLSL